MNQKAIKTLERLKRKSRCPVCAMDLTRGAKVLGAETARMIHLNSHFSEWSARVRAYVEKKQAQDPEAKVLMSEYDALCEMGSMEVLD